MPPEDRYVDLDSLQLHYLRAGSDDDPPVVLLHGGGLDTAALSWKETIPALADEWSVFAPDWPGYGDSDPPDGSPSIDYYVSILERFLDALDLDAVRLVGISMGGGVAIGFSLAHPERVERLVAVDSYGLGGKVPGGPVGASFVRTPMVADLTWSTLASSRWTAKQAVSGVVASANLTDELVDEVYALLRDPDAGEAWTEFQRNEIGFGGLRTDYTDRLPELRVPTLFVHGEDDPLIPLDWSVRAGTLVPDADVAAIPDCGHWPPREKPEEFVRVVEKFL